MTFGGRGTYANVGIPGTGMSVRQRFGGTSRTQRQTQRDETQTEKVSINIHLDDNGNVEFQDLDGNLLSEDLVRQAKRQQGDNIRQWLADECDKVNQQIHALETIHLDTPAPNQQPTYAPTPFKLPRPDAPILKPLGILARLVKRMRVRIERENTAAQEEVAGSD